MTIAVTGATGHLGRLALTELLRTVAAEDLVALVRDPARATDLRDAGIEVRAADYTDEAALDAALRGVDSLLLVSSSEVGQRFAQHRSVIDAAARAGVRHLVYTSLTRADVSANPLAPEHKETEEYLAGTGLVTTILRNNWYTENYLDTVNTARESGVITAAAGAGHVASASRADYAAAAAAVLTGTGHEGKIYELTGATAWDFPELAETIGRILGTEVRYEPVTGAELTARLTSAGLDTGTAGFVTGLDTAIAAGTLDLVTEDLPTLLGRPASTLEDGLRAALA